MAGEKEKRKNRTGRELFLHVAAAGISLHSLSSVLTEKLRVLEESSFQQIT